MAAALFAFALPDGDAAGDDSAAWAPVEASPAVEAPLVARSPEGFLLLDALTVGPSAFALDPAAASWSPGAPGGPVTAAFVRRPPPLSCGAAGAAGAAAMNGGSTMATLARERRGGGGGPARASGAAMAAGTRWSGSTGNSVTGGAATPGPSPERGAPRGAPRRPTVRAASWWISASTVSSVGAPARWAKPGSASSIPRLGGSKA